MVDHDLMGAARAYVATKGIACILGTGSNSCYFNGKKLLRIARAWVMCWAMKAVALSW
jgi:hexokinase